MPLVPSLFLPAVIIATAIVLHAAFRTPLSRWYRRIVLRNALHAGAPRAVAAYRAAAERLLSWQSPSPRNDIAVLFAEPAADAHLGVRHAAPTMARAMQWRRAIDLASGGTTCTEDAAETHAAHVPLGNGRGATRGGLDVFLAHAFGEETFSEQTQWRLLDDWE
ncbi:MAG: hypothetical protein RLZZ324_334, partial [Candidatus Parcubacteria bacterium]